MRARIIAVFILIVLIGIPVFLYWLFFVKNISSVEIFLGKNIPAKVDLKGTFSYDWLPIADKTLYFSQDCQEKCIFSPIPPADYSIKISAENFSVLEEKFSLTKGEEKHLSFSLVASGEFEKISLPFSSETEDERIIFSDDVHEKLGEKFFYIGMDIKGKRWLYRVENSNTTVGIFRDGKFFPQKHFPIIFDNLTLFPLHGVMMAESGKSKMFFTTDFGNILETTFDNHVEYAFFSEKMWHIATKDKTFYFQNNLWKENIRFSHFIDLDNTWRAGYINKDNFHALKLGNHDESKGSVLLLLNRKNGQVFEIARELEISAFFIFDGKIVFQVANQFYFLKIPQGL